MRFDYYVRVEAEALLRGRMVEVFSIFSIERRAATPTIRRTIYRREARLVQLSKLTVRNRGFSRKGSLPPPAAQC